MHGRSQRMTTRVVLSSILLASGLALLPTGTNATSERPDATKLGLYSVRNSIMCAAVVSTGRNSSLGRLGEPPDPRAMFGNAEKLPLSECRHPHDFVVVQEGRYGFFSNIDAVASMLGRNYSITFCVSTEYTVHFSCYKNGERYFVAPTDYERKLIRGPIGFYKCPQTFEALYGEHLSMVGDEQQCATFLTVSSYGVRTHNGDCIHLFRYAQFKEYPEVWNGCQRYTEASTGNTYDCRFAAAAKPWKYPTHEEVSRCADCAPRVPCSSVQFNLKAGARYFSTGRDVREMTQNKKDSKRCRGFDIEDFIHLSDTARRFGGSHYARTAVYGGGGAVVVAVVALVFRLMCRLFLCGSLCSREPEVTAAVECSSVSFPAQATSSPPPLPTSGSSSAVLSTQGQPNNSAGGVVVGQMRSVFSASRTPSDVPYGRLHEV